MHFEFVLTVRFRSKRPLGTTSSSSLQAFPLRFVWWLWRQTKTRAERTETLLLLCRRTDKKDEDFIVIVFFIPLSLTHTRHRYLFFCFLTGRTKGYRMSSLAPSFGSIFKDTSRITLITFCIMLALTIHRIVLPLYLMDVTDNDLSKSVFANALSFGLMHVVEFCAVPVFCLLAGLFSRRVAFLTSFFACFMGIFLLGVVFNTAVLPLAYVGTAIIGCSVGFTIVSNLVVGEKALASVGNRTILAPDAVSKYFAVHHFAGVRSALIFGSLLSAAWIWAVGMTHSFQILFFILAVWTVFVAAVSVFMLMNGPNSELVFRQKNVAVDQSAFSLTKLNPLGSILFSALHVPFFRLWVVCSFLASYALAAVPTIAYFDLLERSFASSAGTTYALSLALNSATAAFFSLMLASKISGEIFGPRIMTLTALVCALVGSLMLAFASNTAVYVVGIGLFGALGAFFPLSVRVVSQITTDEAAREEVATAAIALHLLGSIAGCATYPFLFNAVASTNAAWSMWAVPAASLFVCGVFAILNFSIYRISATEKAPNSAAALLARSRVGQLEMFEAEAGRDIVMVP
eukprot:ANDGO_05009.mRNA.1 hypothetical protein